MQKSIVQRHSIIKEGEKKEEVFRRVQGSSGIDEPQDKRLCTEVGKWPRRFRSVVGTG